MARKDEFGGVRESQMHSKVVKRGITGSDFEKEVPESKTYYILGKVNIRKLRQHNNP